MRWSRVLCPLVLAFGVSTPVQANSAFLPLNKPISAPQGFTGIGERYAWACSPTSHRAQSFAHADLMALARRVNLSVNRQVREVSDYDQYRVMEHWSLPTVRGGDCEDFALLKKRELLRLGVEPERLLIATALTREREAHAVLVLRTDAGDLVLDNLTNRIRPWQKTGYTFLRMQDPAQPARWQLLAVGGVLSKRGTS